MQSGKLDRVVTLQTRSATPDGYGQPVESWGTLADVWAEVREERGREFFAGGTASEEKRTFYIRWIGGLTSKDRVLYNGVAHDIRSIREIGRQDGLEILATVVT